MLAVRWYLLQGLSYREVEELPAERGVQVHHVTVYRWVRRFTPVLIDAAHWSRHATGRRWHVDETYVKVSGSWPYVYRAVDEYGQVIDAFSAVVLPAGFCRVSRVSSRLMVFPTSWWAAGLRLREPGGRPGPGLPGFGAPAGRAAFARRFRNPRGLGPG